MESSVSLKPTKPKAKPKVTAGRNLKSVLMVMGLMMGLMMVGCGLFWGLFVFSVYVFLGGEFILTHPDVLM